MTTITPVEVSDIAALLDAYRDRHGITSDEKLADRLGVSDQAIYRWRRGELGRAARILLAVDRELAAASECPTPA